MRERVIHQTGLWAAISALAAALLLAVALAPQAGAQTGTPPPVPHWFWGISYDSLNGATIEAVADDGTVIQGATISGGQWQLQEVHANHGNAKLRITSGSDIRETRSIQLQSGKQTRIQLSEFTLVEPDEPEAAETTIEVRVIARTAPADSPRAGQIEFGLYVDGVDEPWAQVRTGDAAPMFLPPARYFPNPYPSHDRWLRSTLTELGNDCAARVIARTAPADSPRAGQIEFGLYVDGADEPWAQVRTGDAAPMFLPPARYFPNPHPSHSRWLRSTLTEIPCSGS